MLRIINIMDKGFADVPAYANLVISQNFTPVTTTHIAPFDGWLIARTTTSPGYNELFIDSVSVAKISAGAYGTAYSCLNFPFPLRKGQMFNQSSTSGSATLNMFSYI